MKRLGTLLALIALAIAVAAPASAASDAFVLSSWNPTFEEREVSGGVQHVTAIIPAGSTREATTVHLVPPCDCSMEVVAVSHGEVRVNEWVITELAGEASATLEIRWLATPTRGPGPSAGDALLGYRLVGSFLAV